jgi:predicted O-methyltransferase YrrM
MSKIDDIYFMAKSLPYIKSYETIRYELQNTIHAGQSDRVLEIGVYRGGSAPFLYNFFDAKNLVCVDFESDPPPALERFKQSCPPGRIITRYGIDQADRKRMNDIMEAEFPDGLYLVIDDASHRYAPTKSSFETVFPFLRPGGIFVIADWSWASEYSAQLPNHYACDQPALTNLIFQLITMIAAGDGMFDGIGFADGLMWVRKSWKQIPRGTFRLDEHLPLRGKALNLI